MKSSIKRVNLSILILLILFIFYKAMWVRMVLENTTSEPVVVIAIGREEGELWKGVVKPHNTISFHFIPKYDGVVRFDCTKENNKYTRTSEYYTRRFGGKHIVSIGESK